MTMWDTIDVEKFTIEVSKSPAGSKMLALITIQYLEMRIKGFVVAEGVDRNTGVVGLYVTPPKAGNRRPGKKPTMYFFLEGEGKWERLHERMLEAYKSSSESKAG
jgi:hypothetical protein